MFCKRGEAEAAAGEGPGASLCLTWDVRAHLLLRMEEKPGVRETGGRKGAVSWSRWEGGRDGRGKGLPLRVAGTG